MKDELKIIPLGDAVAKMKTGSTPPTSHAGYFGGDIPWFTPGDIGSTKNLVESTRTLTQEAIFEGEAKLFEKGMLLVTCIGDIGRVGILQQPSYSNQQITALKFKDDIDSDFAYYWFVSNKKKLVNLANQAIVPILNNERLSEIEFAYPPLTEQKRIASLLTRADRLRQLRRTAHDLGDALLQSVFLEMFGEYIYSGDFIELGDEIILGPSNGIYKSEEYFGSGTLLLDIKGLYKSFYADFNTARRIQTTDSELKKYQVADGDILINRVSKMPEGVGKTVLVRNSPEPFVYESNMMRFRVNSERLNGIYLVYFLASEFSRKDLISKSNISNQASINQETVRSLKISVPPLSLQEEFAGVVARVESLSGRMGESTRQVEGLFDALLAQTMDNGR